MSGNDKNKGRKMRPCPICSKLSTLADYPFCSERCAKIDLHRWLSEGYSIPAVEADEPEDVDPDTFQG